MLEGLNAGGREVGAVGARRQQVLQRCRCHTTVMTDRAVGWTALRLQVALPGPVRWERLRRLVTSS